MKNVILDTDIGDDIDDALALSYMCNSKEFNLVGVTTVYMNTVERAKLACAVLEVLNRQDVPVVAGYGKAMTQSVKTYNQKLKIHKPRQMEVLKEVYTYMKPLDIDVVEFLNKKINQYKGNISLVTIGGLTNIAMLLKKYPGAAKKIKMIYMMGGVAFITGKEWNIICDPEAARIVFNSGIPIKMVGLDVTLKCRLKESDIRKIENNGKPVSDLLGKLIRLWQKQNGKNPYTKKYPTPTLHDPLAAMVGDHPEVIRFEPFKVDVETKGELTRAQTVIVGANFDIPWKCHPSIKPTADVAVDVNAKKAVNIFMKNILR